MKTLFISSSSIYATLFIRVGGKVRGEGSPGEKSYGLWRYDKRNCLTQQLFDKFLFQRVNNIQEVMLIYTISFFNRGNSVNAQWIVSCGFDVLTCCMLDVQLASLRHVGSTGPCSNLFLYLDGRVYNSVTREFLWRYAPVRRTGTFFPNKENKLCVMYIINE